METNEEELDKLVADLAVDSIVVSKEQAREAVRSLAEIIALVAEEGLIDRHQ